MTNKEWLIKNLDAEKEEALRRLDCDSCAFRGDDECYKRVECCEQGIKEWLKQER